MKKLLYLLLFVVGCNGQDKNKPIEKEIEHEDVDYYIGDYLINPKHKKISVMVEVGGVNWDGYEYQQMRDVDFDTTSLIFMGNSLFFKEQLPFLVDWETVEITNSGKHYEIFRDNNNVYLFAQYGRGFNKEISEYKALDNGFYLDKNNEVQRLEIREQFEFYKVKTDEKVNFETLKKLTESYYYDKNGLYFTTQTYNRETNETFYALNKVCSSNGKEITPILNSKYLIYGNSVYSTAKPLKLDLDIKKIVELTKEYAPNDFSFLTDGKNVYRATDGGYDTISKSEIESKLNVLLLNDIFLSNINTEYVFSERLKLCQKNSSDLIFQNENHKSCTGSAVGRLIKTSKGYYLLPTDSNRQKARKINEVYIYNANTQKEEIFELDKFKYHKDGFFTYKNILYWGNYIVFSDDFDINKFEFVQNTNYFTDGSNLFNAYSIQGYRRNDTIKGKVVLDERSLILNNISNIKRINENILIVNDTIIVSNNNEGVPIPISKLGIDVKIYTN